MNFAWVLAESAGELTDAEFAAARAAGLTDAQIVEIIAFVSLNVLTNLIGKAIRIDIDFPKVALLDAPARAAA